jgi:3-methylfumaryl-CoA hydratase
LLGIEGHKKSTILSVDEKEGSSGKLCFVTVKHQYFQNGELCLIEEHDIVYREDPKINDKHINSIIAPTDWEICEKIKPSSTLLFRYSALTFNGHRIHYDNEYAINTEGYNGLVFHGPLVATLLVDLSVRLSQKKPSYFEFRGISPISGPNDFSIACKKKRNDDELWEIKKDGTLSMKAKAVL